MSSAFQADPYAVARERMVRTQLADRGIQDQRVLAAMRRVPRHEFVPERYRDQAYEDHPLPIGEFQTISQPYIVASMLDALALQPQDRVLEVGTGSGYVTALLAELAGEVFSVERYEKLALRAREMLAGLGYTNAKVIVGDGTEGLPDCAPFDAITVAAATPEVPRALLAQLGDGGRMIVPVGPAESQQLQLIRMLAGRPHTTLREPCRFVPLVPGVSEPEEDF